MAIGQAPSVPVFNALQEGLGWGARLDRLPQVRFRGVGHVVALVRGWRENLTAPQPLVERPLRPHDPHKNQGCTIYPRLGLMHPSAEAFV